jgi:hypothetical protein
MNYCEYLYDFDCEACDESGFGCHTHRAPFCDQLAKVKDAGLCLCEQHYNSAKQGDFGRPIPSIRARTSVEFGPKTHRDEKNAHKNLPPGLQKAVEKLKLVVLHNTDVAQSDLDIETLCAVIKELAAETTKVGMSKYQANMYWRKLTHFAERQYVQALNANSLTDESAD